MALHINEKKGSYIRNKDKESRKFNMPQEINIY